MPGEKRMPLSGHLRELRYRLLATAVPWLVLVGIGFTQAGRVLEWLRPQDGTLVFLAPAEAFLTYLRIAAYLATAAVLPLALYHAAAFAAPGLEPGERRLMFLLLPAAVVLFAAGVAFGFTVVRPIALAFFLGFAGEGLEPMISVGRYLSFVAGTTLPVGLVFQTPVVIYLLARLGIVSGEGLRRSRPYALLIILVVAAVVTPPDVISQVLVAVPMYALYELSIWIARAVGGPPRRS
ncbi:MAG: twin-arginine translocase subunit TatC [Thermaerobacter sp.]|nr:twin-arginine translocase subunit TatC [Bacillota bacterium]